MPTEDRYTAEVTVSVQLISEQVEPGVVVSAYSVKRRYGGNGTGRKPSDIIDDAVVRAVAHAKSLAAGVDNAEKRRLK